MWEERYSTDGYFFGREPSQFLTKHAAYLKAGQRALAVADGEGRNSVHMAEAGMAVTAFDYAPAGIAKAQRLAEEKGVTVDFRLSDIGEWDWAKEQFDAVFGIFIQFLEPDQRTQVFSKIADAVKPGGFLLLHGYTPEQISYGTGGPPRAEMMYTPDLLRAAFPQLEIITLETYLAELDEGPGHSGTSALIDFIARKPL